MSVHPVPTLCVPVCLGVWLDVPCQVCRSPFSRKSLPVFTCISAESRVCWSLVVTFLPNWSAGLRRPRGCVANVEKENGGRPAPGGQGGRPSKWAVFLEGILSVLSPSSEERPELCLQVEDRAQGRE